MVMYKNYQPFRSWLNKYQTDWFLKAKANAQSKKPRSGNVFMIIGANGYIGWASICQLVYKFQSCTIIAVDKNVDSQPSILKNYDLYTKMSRLRDYFEFEFEIVNSEINSDIIHKYKPDFIIDFSDNAKNLMKMNEHSHLILYTSIDSKNDFSNDIFKVTEFRIPYVAGTCNLITLVDPVLSTKNSDRVLLNRMIYGAFNNKKIVVRAGKIAVISLEDVTRSSVKVIRRGQKNYNVVYYAYDKNLCRLKIANIIKQTLKNFDHSISIQIKPIKSQKIVSYNKRPFLKLIDKHRPPVEFLISYSCKNYLEMRA